MPERRPVEVNGFISRGNMTVILSAAGLVMLAFGGFITVQNSANDLRISAVDRRISDFKDELSRIENNYIRKDELARAEANYAHKDDLNRLENNYLRKDEHLEFRYRVDRDIGLLRDEQTRRANVIVPRVEHEARWAATDAGLKQLSDRLNELRTATTSTYTERDEIKRLQDEMAQLRRDLHAPKNGG